MDKSTAIKSGLAALTLSAFIAFGIYEKQDPNAPDASAIDAAIDAQVGALATDLLSEVVPPGKVVVTGVNLPDGYLFVPGTLSLTGDAVGKFQVADVKQDGATLRVMAENTSRTAVRFTAVFNYDKPAAPP